MTTIPSHFSEITDKLDSNIALEESLLDMFGSLNGNNNNEDYLGIISEQMLTIEFIVPRTIIPKAAKTDKE
jgi:hypothetical protein